MAVVVESVFSAPAPRPVFASRGQRIRFYFLLLAVLILSACTFARGRGYFSVVKRLVRPTPGVFAAPSVAMTFPPDGAIGMPAEIELAAEFKSARGGGIDADSIDAA